MDSVVGGDPIVEQYKTKMTKNKQKRQHENSSDSDSSTTSNNWPRFIMVESIDKTNAITKLSPFVILKALQGISGEPKSVKKLRSGEILVEVEKQSHSRNLLNAKTFAGITISASPHKSLNFSKGVVRCRDIEMCSVDELKIELKDQGVVDVRQATTKRNGEIIKLNTYILTFSTPKRPEEIKIAYFKVKVDAFIPSPLRCFKCQRFGHHKDSCKKNCSTCARCGEEGHEMDTCQKAHKCVNCNGPHTSFSKDCTKWKFEVQVQTVRTHNNISFPEARKLVESTLPKGQTYAQVATKQYATIATQTDTERSGLPEKCTTTKPKTLESVVVLPSKPIPRPLIEREKKDIKALSTNSQRSTHNQERDRSRSTYRKDSAKEGDDDMTGNSRASSTSSQKLTHRDDKPIT